MLKGSVQEKWDRNEKKTKRRFFVNRTFRYPDLPESLEAIEDAVPAGKTIDEAIEMLEAEKQRFEFFKRYNTTRDDARGTKDVHRLSSIVHRISMMAKSSL